MNSKINFLFKQIAIILVGFISSYSVVNGQTQSQVFDVKNMNGGYNPELSKWYFEHWYEPYGTITPEMRMKMLNDIKKLPNETDAVNNWIFWGPEGLKIYSDPSNYYSGRITDIDVDNTASTRIAAASGGVWGFFLFFPIPLSDNLSASLNIGTFRTKPGDNNTILVGTGEPYTGLWGAGIFKTTDGGTSYTQCTMNPLTPPACYKIRYSTSNTSIVHAGCLYGYFRSTDGGNTWNRIAFTTSDVTDIAINPSNNNIIFAPVWGDGIYESVNAGLNWTKLGGGLPTTNVGRTTISICASNTSVIYANIARNDNNQTLGVFKSVNGGTTWSNVSPPSEFHWGQGWYNTLCGVCPTNANKIIVGGGALWESVDGGTTWTNITTVHADQHAITWNSTGTSVWVGNDGGMFASLDGGTTFTSNANFLPITQYVIFDVHPAGNYCFGGSQDNGISGTTNRGTTWYHFLGGDGGGAAIDPSTPSTVAMTNGVYGGSWAFRRVLSTNNGVNWNFIDNGIDPAGDWYHRIRSDKISPVFLFDYSGPFVYETTNYGTGWFKLNTTAFSTTGIMNMSLPHYSGGEVIYVCLNNTQPSSDKLKVYDISAWYERSAGLPANNTVRKVATHPSNNNVAYALINGFSAGQKIFKTTNRGVLWTNITGDLPDLPLSDLIPHPTNNNNLYLGTSMGCYKTTNGGVNWVRWNNGMPNATICSEMGYIDSITANGRFYVVNATYGRSIWYREVSGDDPIGIRNIHAKTPDRYELSQNYPNPFNPTTTINFSLPATDKVRLNVYDITGRLVSSIYDGELKAGVYSMKFDGSNIASGVYFYKLITQKMTVTKKMILIK